ncbi:MAG: WG repeat-containing protein [Bacteroidales bacterium]|nr:WG repeat-containing protein [Bacteroidales bacterium]
MDKFVAILLALVLSINALAQDYPQRVNENGKVGYKLSGKWIASPVYEYGSEFRNGFAMVRLDGKFGFIDDKGNIVVKCLYNSCTLYDENGVATGKIGETRYYLDKNGNAFRSMDELKAAAILKSSDYKNKANNYSVGDYTPTLDESGKWGYKQFGEWVIKPRFDAAGDFADGLAAVSLGGKWGYIGKNGSSSIPFKYEQGGVFVDGLARVKLYGKWGFIDKSGATVIPFKYAMAADFSNGLAHVSYNGKNGYIDKTGEWFDSEEEMMQTFSAFARHFVEADINQWQKKGKYEKMAQWQKRVTDRNRKARIDSLVSVARENFIASESKKIRLDYSIVDYDSESEVFLVHDKRFGNLLVPVPIREAEKFENSFSEITRKDVYCVNGDNLGLREAKFVTPYGRTYKYNNTASLSFASLDIDYNFEAVNFEEEAPKASRGSQTIASANLRVGQSDVDQKIPDTHTINDNTFALIITNENYKFVSQVPYAINDGRVFEEYCVKTLGLPKDHIHRAEDATFGMVMGEMDWITNIAKVYKGKARIMVYYAGHGIPDESTRDAYLLPVDGTGSNTSTAIKLSSIYSRLNDNPTESTVVFLDACFSGAQRNGQMLAQARGVAIKAKAERPSGTMVVFSAASGDETAYPYKEKGHGLFSYFLMKKIQETRGEATLGELAAYISENVSQQAIVQNAKSQTPTVVPSAEIGDKWKNIKLK